MSDNSHRLLPMSGRDPDESHRAATPLELLFDLTLVVAFGTAGNELAHALAAGHVGSGLAGFVFASFAICWAWINYSWFASAYDTDDWAFRLLTMVQMVGVIVLALGLPEMFASMEEGERLDVSVMVGGYVVMRVAMCGQWLRVWKQDPARRRAAATYFLSIFVGQVMWCALVFSPLSIPLTFTLLAVPLAIELAGPYVAERRFGGTPWHPHHIAERYGLLAIITLGEGIIGTVAVMSVIVHEPEMGWSADAILVLAAGIGLTFGQWWTYFMIPWAEIIYYHRERSFVWGYGHIVLFASIAATGAGMHTAAYYLEEESELGVLGTVLAVAIPVGVYAAVLYTLYALSMRAADPFHLVLLAGSAVVLVLGVLLAAGGLSMPWCLVIVALTPVVTIIGYEALGHRHVEEHVERLRA